MKNLVAAILLLFAGFQSAFGTGASFDPEKGFKPAQTDLNEIFLQIAGSLEHYGSPVPYLRHMKAEHARIEAEFRRVTGKEPQSRCPTYIDEDYIDKLAVTWDKLSPKLGLNAMTTRIGESMISALSGNESDHNILVELLRQHQESVFDKMAGKVDRGADFHSLQAQLSSRLKLDWPEVSQTAYQITKRDAVSYSQEIQGSFSTLFTKLDGALPEEDAKRIEAVLLSIVTAVGEMAQSELEGGISEWAIRPQVAVASAATTPPGNRTEMSSTPYNAEQETALSVQEKKTFAGFLIKERFTKSDFPSLEKFYATAYDKLSERGKDEMSRRVWRGTRSSN